MRGIGVACNVIGVLTGDDIVFKDKIRVKDIDNPNVKFPAKSGEVPGGV